MRNGRRVTWPEAVVLSMALAAVAAVPVAGAIRSRIASNEATTIGDLRTVMLTQAAYRSANSGWFESNFACLALHGGCLPSTPITAPTFLDSQLASLAPRAGYARSRPSFGAAPAPADPTVSPTSVGDYVYTASPMEPNVTGVRGFGADGTGFICSSVDGTQPTHAFGRLTRSPNCRPLQ
jgi:hypothetical protein